MKMDSKEVEVVLVAGREQGYREFSSASREKVLPKDMLKAAALSKLVCRFGCQDDWHRRPEENACDTMQ